jgi:hypothetical protein
VWLGKKSEKFGPVFASLEEKRERRFVGGVDQEPVALEDNRNTGSLGTPRLCG